MGVVPARRRVVGRTLFIAVVVLFALLNVYRSTTLLTGVQSPSSSHEFAHRQRLQQRHSTPPPPVNYLPADDRSTPRPEVDLHCVPVEVTPNFKSI